MNLQQFKDEIVINHLPYPNESEQIFKWYDSKFYNDGRLYNKPLIPNNKYSPKVKDKLYFYPDCNVPRYKVREWAKKNDISITVIKEKSNAKFATNDTIKSYINNGVFVKINKIDFISWLDINNYDKTSASYITLITVLTNHTYVYLEKYQSNIYAFSKTVDWDGTANNIKTSHGLIRGYDDKNVSIVVEDYYQKDTTDDKNLKIIESLITDNAIYNQESIISLINEDAITIDEYMFSRLRDMFLSESKSDHLVALEIVANCNINPSLHYVLLLLREFNVNITNLKESKHINFKSLLEYIGISRGSMGYLAEDKIVNILMQKDVLTMRNVKELASGIKDVMKRNSDTTHFLISKITISEEVITYLKNKQVQKELVLN
jgi:hypothetical protein